MKYHYQIRNKNNNSVDVSADSRNFLQENNITPFKGYDTEDIARCQASQHMEDSYLDVRKDYCIDIISMSE